MGIHVGIDTGGTFTDLVAVDDDSGTWSFAKVPSSPADPVVAIRGALRAAAIDTKAVSSIVVGTTIGINGVLTRSGARVLLLTTAGFEDIPFIQRISRKYHYDYSWKKPRPLLDRPDCVGVRERTDEEGRTIIPLDLEEVAGLVQARLDTDGSVPAVAVCYLFSYLNSEPELATAQMLAERFPQLSVSLSHEVAPIWREFERGSTVIVDAYLKPLLHEYVAGVSQGLRDEGVAASWALLKSNGGHAPSEGARDRPAHLLLSGIAGGAIGAAHFARSRSAEQAIMLDMGGTSCDVCLIDDGEPLYSSDYEIEYGLPVSVPTISTKTIGAGGGSIGWVDPGGFLQVGPQSAGASPGPACYPEGGDEPTVTDANVVLGRLNPDFFLGGGLRLNAARSYEALACLGDRLGLPAVEVASSVVSIANENMANAIRIVTVEEGIDPRGFALIAAGGAGPTHAAEIADAIGISRVVVPANPGLCSAFGALAAQVRVDAVRSISLVADRASATEVNRLFDDLEQQARADFDAQGSSGQERGVRRALAMRYQGQNYEQLVSIGLGTIGDSQLSDIVERYHRLHEAFYGYRFEGMPVELVRASVVIVGPEPTLAGMTPAPSPERRDARPIRDVYFPGYGFVPTPLLRWEDAQSGAHHGPAIVELTDSTVVVPPTWMVRPGDSSSLEMHRREEIT